MNEQMVHMTAGYLGAIHRIPVGRQPCKHLSDGFIGWRHNLILQIKQD